MNLRKAGTITQSTQKKNSTPYQVWLMGMMDSKYESRRGVRSYLELNGMNIDPDVTFNNSCENDEEQIQSQSEFDHKIDETLELLETLFPELVNDGNHGIDSFCQVQDELIKIMLWANIMQMVCFPLPRPTFCEVKVLLL